jgi:hypothetical protein
MLMGSNDRAIDRVHRPVQLASGSGLLVDGRKEALPDAGFLPAIEAAGHGAPRTRAFGHIAPGSTGTQQPHDAVEEASMVQSRLAGLRFLRGKQRLEPLPWRIRAFFVFHPDEWTSPVRVCKHALAFLPDACYSILAS